MARNENKNLSQAWARLGLNILDLVLAGFHPVTKVKKIILISLDLLGAIKSYSSAHLNWSILKYYADFFFKCKMQDFCLNGGLSFYLDLYAQDFPPKKTMCTCVVQK